MVAQRREKEKESDLEQIFRKAERMNMQINAKIEEISYWREFASKAEIVFGAVRSGNSKKNKSRVEECVCKISDIEESLKNDMDELIALKENAMRIIDRVDVPEYRNLLVQRYLCGKKWDDVANAMGYSYGHIVHRLHPKALERIKKMGDEN